MRQLVVGFVLSLSLLSACEVSSPPVRSSASALWNEQAGRPQLLTGHLFHAKTDGEATARAFLASRAAEFHLDAEGSSLTLSTTREGLSGTYYRFAQQQRVGAQTLPVFGGEVIVLVKDEGESRTVRAVNLEQFDAASGVREEGDVGAFAALESAKRFVAATGPFTLEPTTVRGVHVDAGRARVAWRVTLTMEEASPPHDWTVFVDAATGALLGTRDGVHFQATVTGTGYVYDMNAVAASGDLTLTDNNNLSSPALDAARSLVALPHLDGSGFTRGTWADVGTRTNGNRAMSATNDFLFSRSDLGFEQANAYYHLDRAQQRVQALGFMNVNNRVQAAVTDAQQQDNSFYTNMTKRLSFGTGGVDDAEDGDIVTHEYGHSIQDDQVPGFGGGDEGAIGEGFGDYLAASFSVSLPADAGHLQLADPACVGDWDGTFYSTTTPKCLRRVDGVKHYPEAETGEVHDDGEMWSAALWRLRAQLGGDQADTLVLEAQFLMGTSSSFFAASQSLISADATAMNGAHELLIRRTMIRQGLSRTLSPPAILGPVTSLPLNIGPVRDSAGNYRNDTDEVRTVTVPGATGLMVHFTRLEFEVNNQCLNRSCDNLYLTNADGDLFQVLSGGPQTNVTSVAVAGDTVNLRMVSDNSQARFGYQVDRVDVLGAPDDAGIVYDGGMDFFDAGMPPPPRDAGPPPPPLDAGSPGRDAGSPSSDAGMMPQGTYTLPRAGLVSLSPALARGCGCGATSGADALALLALLGLWRRRNAR